MGDRKTSIYDEKERLLQLEQRIDALISLCDQLRAENQDLRQRQAEILAERSDLLNRNEVARERVESIISRLKEMETEAQ
ncbi:MAG: TIGR02449 family protein [Gammaproteobacteria bacterium]|nr:TIGR02449 family protein [Gammaproteobacteria bacterium]MDH5731661.1 TIGR02449 family protein [Gammaproteobacteria bacterium]